MPSSRRGFTLIEVLTAIVVLAIGILAVFGSMAYGIRSTELSARTTEAVTYGRELIDLVRTRNLPFTVPITEISPVALNAAPFAADLPANTGFRREISMARLKAAETGEPDDYQVEVAQVTVRLIWDEHGVEKDLVLRAYHRQP